VAWNCVDVNVQRCSKYIWGVYLMCSGVLLNIFGCVSHFGPFATHASLKGLSCSIIQLFAYKL